MQYVFVIDKNKKPRDPCHPKVARELLKGGFAAVHKQFPFAIILKHESNAPSDPIRLKIDPGSKETGLALVSDKTKKVLFGANLKHRGSAIKKRLEQRRALRRSRRNRNCRYRKPRFLNRTRPKGWLPPSLQSRISNVETWTRRFSKISDISSLSFEHAPFDTQKMQYPEISGIEYQHGESEGFEVREYLLLKWGRKCSYCGKSDVPLEVEHIIPKSRGGSNRISNLCLACRNCNQSKNDLTAEEFGYPEIQNKAKKSLKDASVMTSTRWILLDCLKSFGFPIESDFGYRTKWNRKRQGFKKDHWIDAACIGRSGENITLDSDQSFLRIEAKGHGCRQVTRVDKFGFPRQSAKGSKSVFGFQTGDMVKAIVTKGKKIGIYIGRIAIRSTGSFNIRTTEELVQGISHRNCHLIHRRDGYSYLKGGAASSVA